MFSKRIDNDTQNSSGAATEVTLTAINTKLGAALPLSAGAATELTLAAVNTKLGLALPLPTGAATELTLAAVNTKLGSALPLPTGAATETTLGALNTKVTLVGTAIKTDGSTTTLGAATTDATTAATTRSQIIGYNSALAYQSMVLHDTGLLPTIPFDFYVQDLNITRSGTPARIITIFGIRNQWNSTVLHGDVCAYLVGGQNKMNTPLVGTTYYINSTSAQDLFAGTGVDKVRVIYLDAAGVQQTVTVTLNGTTAVSMGAGFTFIQWMESYHSTIADRLAVGNITISSVNGVATEATTVEMILLDSNRSQSLRYMVPAGKVAYLIDMGLSAISANFQTKIRATKFNDNDAISNTYHFLDDVAIQAATTYVIDEHYKKLPALSVIKLSAIPSAIGAGNRLSGSINLLVY